MAVRSVAQGKSAELSADHFIKTGKPLGIKRPFNSSFGHLMKEEFDEYLKDGVKQTRIEPEKGFISGFTPEEAVREASRCMHCDCRKPLTCKLRTFANEYGAKQKRFTGPVRAKITKSVRHDHVIYEPEKCIRCGLCVEITQMSGEAIGLSYIGRGFDVRIGVPFSQSVKEALQKTAQVCVEACPTGALAEK